MHSPPLYYFVTGHTELPWNLSPSGAHNESEELPTSCHLALFVSCNTFVWFFCAALEVVTVVQSSQGALSLFPPAVQYTTLTKKLKA